MDTTKTTRTEHNVDTQRTEHNIIEQTDTDKERTEDMDHIELRNTSGRIRQMPTHLKDYEVFLPLARSAKRIMLNQRKYVIDILKETKM